MKQRSIRVNLYSEYIQITATRGRQIDTDNRCSKTEIKQVHM